MAFNLGFSVQSLLKTLNHPNNCTFCSQVAECESFGSFFGRSPCSDCLHKFNQDDSMSTFHLIFRPFRRNNASFCSPRDMSIGNFSS